MNIKKSILISAVFIISFSGISYSYVARSMFGRGGHNQTLDTSPDGNIVASYNYSGGLMSHSMNMREGLTTIYKGGQPHKVVWSDDHDEVVLTYHYIDGVLSFTEDQYQSRTYFEKIGDEMRPVRKTQMYDGGIEVTETTYIYEGGKLVKSIQYELPEKADVGSKRDGDFPILSITYYDDQERPEKMVYQKTEKRPHGTPSKGWSPSYKAGDVRYYHYDGDQLKYMSDQHGRVTAEYIYNESGRLIAQRSWNYEDYKKNSPSNLSSRSGISNVFGARSVGRRGAKLTTTYYNERGQVDYAVGSDGKRINYHYNGAKLTSVTYQGSRNRDTYNKYGRVQNRHRPRTRRRRRRRRRRRVVSVALSFGGSSSNQYDFIHTVALSFGGSSSNQYDFIHIRRAQSGLNALKARQ